eukprot:m.336756 g.336756  ORF g.336756 m.336756 type:complete len:125 (+) comp17952_c0_seq1:97-471(+)
MDKLAKLCNVEHEFSKPQELNFLTSCICQHCSCLICDFKNPCNPSKGKPIFLGQHGKGTCCCFKGEGMCQLVMPTLPELCVGNAAFCCCEQACGLPPSDDYPLACGLCGFHVYGPLKGKPIMPK